MPEEFDGGVYAWIEIGNEVFDAVEVDFVWVEASGFALLGGGLGVVFFQAGFVGVDDGFAVFGVEDVDEGFAVFRDAVENGDLGVEELGWFRGGGLGAGFIGGIAAGSAGYDYVFAGGGGVMVFVGKVPAHVAAVCLALFWGEHWH